MAYGLLRVIPGDKLPQNDLGRDELPDVVESELTRHILKHWETNRDAKIRIEEGLLEDLRAKNGEYHPQKLTAIREQGGSEIYMMLTSTKQRAASNWIKDIILPEDDKAWGLSPTPLPDLPVWADQMIAQRVAENHGTTQDAMQLREYVQLEMSEQAKYSCDKMEQLIRDQLDEMKWAKVVNDLIDDFTTFSAAILKGPVLKKRKSLSWRQGFGTMKPKIKEKLRLEFERVSPFDIYPSPQSEDVNDGHLIEHIRFERGELYNMIGVPGYKEAEIRKVLEDYKMGRHEWLWHDYERNESEHKHHWFRDHQSGLIDGLHYWGSAQGSTLADWGLDIPDKQAEYQIDAILIGNYVIRCSINNDPLARRPYHKASYDPIPGAFWGNSIRYLMADIQEFCNAAARALVNNMAFASGPMVEINFERLSPLETDVEIYPWKVWQTRGAEVGAGSTVQFFQPSSNAAELMSVYERFEIKADDATAIPRYAHGNEKVAGAGRTATGLSMLMGSAAKGIKAAIGNFDFGITRPSIEMVYYYNMITTKDPSVQGDVQVVARGANALLLKDMAQQRRSEFLQLTANELDLSILGKEGRADILRAIAKDFNMDGIIPSKEEIRRRLEEEAANPQPDPEVIKAEMEAQIEQVKQEGEAARFEIEMKYKERALDLQREKDVQNHEQRMREIEVKKEIELEKQRKEEAMKIRLMKEETKRIIERAEINAEADMEKHSLVMEEKEADRKIKSTEGGLQEINKEPTAIETYNDNRVINQTENEKNSTSQAQPPMILNVTIDNQSGKVKKTIEINRDKDNRMKTLDVTETPVQEQDNGMA